MPCSSHPRASSERVRTTAGARGKCARVHRSKRHPRPGASGPTHMNEVCPDGAPNVPRLHQGRREGRLCLLGGGLRQLPSASQNGGDPPEDHVPPTRLSRLMGEGHR